MHKVFSPPGKRVRLTGVGLGVGEGPKTETASANPTSFKVFYPVGGDLKRRDISPGKFP